MRRSDRVLCVALTLTAMFVFSDLPLIHVLLPLPHAAQHGESREWGGSDKSGAVLAALPPEHLLTLGAHDRSLLSVGFPSARTDQRPEEQLQPRLR